MPVLAASSSSSLSSASSLLPLISTDIPPIQKYGTPVGVVILPNKDIQPFRQAIQEALPHLKRIHYRGVDPCTSRDNDYKQIHVQTEVAAAIGDGNVHLIEFIKNCGGEFIPGARRKKGQRRARNLSMYLDRKDDDADDDDADNVDDTNVGNNENSSSTTTTTTTTKIGIKQSPKFTFVELFAGIGGFRMGLEQIGGSCVLASEKDEVARAIYRRQFGSYDLVEGDMLDIVSDDFPSNGFDIKGFGR